MQQNIALFILTLKQNQLLVKVVLTMYLNQFMLQLYQTYKNQPDSNPRDMTRTYSQYKNHLEKVLVGLLILF